MSVSTVTQKLDQANAIKGQIREAIMSQNIEVPENTPFSEYPALVESIPGRLQPVTLTPDAEGQTATPAEGFDGFSSVTLPAEPNLIPGNISVGVSIFGVVGTSEVPVFDVNALLAGTLEEITSGTPALRAYGFYNNTVLKRVIMANLAQIGNYAFYGCTGLTSVNAPLLTALSQYMCQNCSNLTEFIAGAVEIIETYAFSGCTKLATLDLSAVEEIKNYGLQNCKMLNVGTLTVPKIGSYGCQYLGSSAASGFKYQPASPADLQSYALQYSKMTELEGAFTAICDYAIANCTSLTKMHVKINGAISQYGLANDTYVNDFELDPESDITSLGNYAFYYLGWNRSSPSTNPMTIDLRNSSFSAMSQYCFGYNRYANIYLPENLATIQNYAIRYSQYLNLYFTGDTPPTIANTNWTSNASNYKLFVPYNHANAYKTATNWTSVSANIVGYAPAGTFTAGAQLPTVNSEGMALTWYSDVAKTQIITVVPEGSPELFCDTSDRAAWVVTINADENTTLTIVDTEGDSYTGNEVFIPIGRGITIDIVAQEGWNNKTVVAGTEVTLPHSIDLLSTDIYVKSISWDGAFNPDWETATWADIQLAVEAGLAVTNFAVGSTRAVTGKSGTVYNFRLANNDTTMYEYADGSGTTGFVMEFVDCIPTTYYMNSSNTNSGGWDASYMRKTVMPLIFKDLPDDMQAVIAEVKIKACQSGTSGTLVTSADKLFLPAEREIFASRTYSRTEEWNALKRWQWYADHDTNNDRIKRRNGSASWWWERSPYSGNSNFFCYVSSSGTANYYSANGSGGVAPGFCI